MESFLFQKQIRDNAEELNEFIKDVDRWQKEMEIKEKTLKESFSSDCNTVPPPKKENRKSDDESVLVKSVCDNAECHLKLNKMKEAKDNFSRDIDVETKSRREYYDPRSSGVVHPVKLEPHKRSKKGLVEVKIIDAKEFRKRSDDLLSNEASGTAACQLVNSEWWH